MPFPTAAMSQVTRTGQQINAYTGRERKKEKVEMAETANI
jgi:hypothetical protein